MYGNDGGGITAFGFTEDDFAPVEVWPENWEIFLLFRRLATQWRVGMGGPTGLEYGVAYRLLDDLAGGDREEWYRLLDDLRVLEQAALEAMRDGEK